MTENVDSFVQNVMNGELADAASNIEAELKSRISDRMESEKINIASSMFDNVDETDVEEVEVDDYVEEE